VADPGERGVLAAVSMKDRLRRGVRKQLDIAQPASFGEIDFVCGYERGLVLKRRRMVQRIEKMVLELNRKPRRPFIQRGAIAIAAGDREQKLLRALNSFRLFSGHHRKNFCFPMRRLNSRGFSSLKRL